MAGTFVFYFQDIGKSQKFPNIFRIGKFCVWLSVYKAELSRRISHCIKLAAMSVQRTNISHRYKIHSHFLQILHKFDHLSRWSLISPIVISMLFRAYAYYALIKYVSMELCIMHMYILCVYIFVCSSGREGVTSLVTVIAASFLRDCRSHHCLCSCPYLVFIWCASKYFIITI